MSKADVPTSGWREGPVAMIVGCGGMGAAVARAVGRRHPLLMLDIDQQRLDQVVADLTVEGFSVAGQRCDITSADDMATLGRLLADGAGVRALAHVAAVGKSIGSWRRMMEIDLFGAAHIAETAGAHMVRGGAALFVSSLASYLPTASAELDAMLDDPLAPGFLDALEAFHGREPDFDWTYAYAKLGVNLLAERMARTWAGRGVRALSLSPGMIDSPMARAEGETLPAHDGTDTRKTRADKAMEIPLRREGSLVEITAVADFLLSDAASFVNGIDVVVDGGHRAEWRKNKTITR